MIDLSKTDLRYRGITEVDSITNTFVRLTLGTDKLVFTNSLVAHNPFSDGTLYQGTLGSLECPAVSIALTAEKGNCTFFDENYKTPASSIYVKIVTNGVLNNRVEVGTYYKVDGKYSDPLIHGVYRTANIQQQRNVVEIIFTPFIMNIDENHTVSLSDASQREIDASDSALAYVGKIRSAFGGPGRGPER